MHSHTPLSAEHAAMFCPVGSNLQLRISAYVQQHLRWAKKHANIPRTPCEPDRLMIGASKLLVRLTVRMRACCLSSLDEEMAI